MQLFSTFNTNIYVEMVISKLESAGIHKESIYAVPLDNWKGGYQFLDSIHRSDGTSMIDIGIALATAFSVVGTSIGFKLAWGPIFWGLITAALGFVLGVLIRIYTEVILRRRTFLHGKGAPIILIIDCAETQADLVENILWKHFATGVAKVK